MNSATGLVLDAASGAAWFDGERLEIDNSGWIVLQRLLDAGGAIVDEPAWSDTVVDVNMALARCSPSAGYIAHFPGQGYQLLAARGTPRARERMLGRGAELARVGILLQEHRFVTIAGPGGMGKTTLARAVAAQFADRYADGVHLVDLAVLAEGRELVGALGVALGIPHLTQGGLAHLATLLRGRRMLIVFDCCEHHVGVAAQVCETLLRAAPGVDVLCTSREPLLAQSERLLRLGPIALPAAGAAPDCATAARSPAIALFVERANRDLAGALVLGEDNVALVCLVCQAVEGVPLALELAAALVRPLGLAMLARRTAQWLLGPSQEPGQGRAGERHRTLSNMLD